MSSSGDRAARRRLAALCALAGSAALAGAVVGSSSDNAPSRAGTGPAPARGRELPGEREAAALPLARQVGQLLLMGFDGNEVPEYIRRRLARGEGAGVILFAKNAPGTPELRSLTGQLQRAARGGALVATDQEGGSIRSLPYLPPEPSQGTLSTPEAAGGAAGEGAAGLREAGVNVNLGPVGDVASVTGSIVTGRAYPGDVRQVSRLVEAAVGAHSRERVAATAKHFPGLGQATANTDDAPVTIAATRAGIERGDLPPFRAAIEAHVPLVMVSHALYPPLDPDAIASQSGDILQALLRGRLGFRGAVVTDSLEAEAVLARSGVAEAAVRSIRAGCDLVLMTGSGSWNLVYPALLRRARRDRAFRGVVAEAAGRVLALKRRLGLTVPAGGPETRSEAAP